MTGSGEPLLTICTVYMSSDRPFIYANWRMVKRLNSRDDWRWIFVDNSLNPGSAELDFVDDAALVIAGASRDESIPARYQISYHHAAGLEKTLRHINSRFALFLDPDCYIVRPDWIDDVISHMSSREISFFGIPYHPKWLYKYRYFPCDHCLFVDLSRVPLESLDFTPGPRFGYQTARNLQQDVVAPSGAVRSFLVRAGLLPAPRLRRLRRKVKSLVETQALPSHGFRKKVNSHRDTGYPIYKLYGRDRRVRYESAVPVFRRGSEFRGPAYALTWKGGLLEKLLPERLCLLLKRSDSYTEHGFREMGYPDVTGRQWEEFMWESEPFSFHLRRFGASGHGAREPDIAVLERVLKAFAH